MVREYRTFKRLTAADRQLALDGLGERPLAVLTRGPDGPADSDRLWQAWHGLQRELASLSRNSRHLIAGESFHSIEISQPEIVIRAIRMAVQESQQ